MPLTHSVDESKPQDSPRVKQTNKQNRFHLFSERNRNLIGNAVGRSKKQGQFLQCFTFSDFVYVREDCSYLKMYLSLVSAMCNCPDHKQFIDFPLEYVLYSYG